MCEYLAHYEVLRHHDQQDFDHIAARLNNRRRRVLGWRTPAEVFNPVAATRHRELAPTSRPER